MNSELPLVLGGHSFIRQLGNDPLPTADEQTAIVAACLDAGIRWFDTTYQPERVALGAALKRLGRRDEATLIAWNFFQTFKPEDDQVGPPDYYRPQHLDQMLAELCTDRIDVLVVHPLQDTSENERQLKLACAWRDSGRVKALGLWAPDERCAQTYATSNPYSFMVRPWNVLTPEAPPIFAAAKQLGWTTLACSPFLRGWHLDKLVAAAVAAGLAEQDAREKLADLLLRYSLFQPNVDRLIVSIRKTEWIAKNAASVKRGKLSDDEQAWLAKLAVPRKVEPS